MLIHHNLHNSTLLVEKYPEDSKFLAEYLSLAKDYDITLGEYSLFRVSKLITLLQNLKEKELLSYCYQDLRNYFGKLEEFTKVPRQALFLDFHNVLTCPSINENNQFESLTLNEMLRRLLSYRNDEDKRELLKNYYDQYFSKL